MAVRIGVGDVVDVPSWWQSDGYKRRRGVNMGGADRNMNTFELGFIRTFAWLQSQPLP
jgi:hypothetical protein